MFIFQLYEIYYHLAVAYQHLNNPKKSVENLTNAITAVSFPKVCCLPIYSTEATKGHTSFLSIRYQYSAILYLYLLIRYLDLLIRYLNVFSLSLFHTSLFRLVLFSVVSI